MNKPNLRALLVSPKFPPSLWDMRAACRLYNSKFLVPPLGLLTVAALLPQEWQFRLVDENVQTLTASDWDWAEVVLLSSQIIQRSRLKELSCQGKEKGKPVAVGGPYPTVNPKEMLSWGADIVVRGEFENQVTSFLDALQAGQTGVILESAEKPDLTTSPIPRFDLIRAQEYVAISLQTTRGCPFDCEFCDVVSLFGRKPRHKAPEQVIAELEAIYSSGKFQFVFVSDDNIIGDKSYARDLFNRMIPWSKNRQEPFVFMVQASVDLGQDKELIGLMTEANISTVFIGIESPDEEVLKAAHKYQNLRHPLVESINTITGNGLTVFGTMIMGFDNERTGVGERIAEFVKATNLPLLQIGLLVPFPKTRLWDRLKREGRLREEILQDDSFNMDFFGGPLTFQPTRPEAEILSEYMELWERLYNRANFLVRTHHYYLSMRPTWSALTQEQAGARPLFPVLQTLPKRTIVKNIFGFMRLSWDYGVKSPYRLQYWKRIFDLRRHNPSRLGKFFQSLALGEDMIQFREVLHQRLGRLPGPIPDGWSFH